MTHRTHQIELRSVIAITDLTPASERALRHAITIARRCRAILSLVYVVSSPAFALAGPFAADLAVEAAARDMSAYVEGLTHAGLLDGLTVTARVLKAECSDELLLFAREQNADVVVMAAQNTQDFLAELFSPNLDALSACCACPVLVVGHHAESPWAEAPSELRTNEAETLVN